MGVVDGLTMADEFGFAEVTWLIFIAGFLALFFIVLVVMLGDLMRDRDLSGGAKALWVLFVVFVPLVGVIVYVIARGDGIVGRRLEAAQHARRLTEG